MRTNSTKAETILILEVSLVHDRDRCAPSSQLEWDPVRDRIVFETLQEGSCWRYVLAAKAGGFGWVLSAHNFTVGDQVWLEATHILSDHPTNKLDDKRYGPFRL